MKNYPARSSFILLVGFLLTITACTTTPPPQRSPTPTATSIGSLPSPTSPPTPTAQPVPHNCPLAPPLQPKTISPALGPVVGQTPVWATLGGGGTPFHFANDNYDSELDGWPFKIVWEVGPNYPYPVQLRAGNLLTGTLLKWDMSPDHQITTTPVLDPRSPGHGRSVIGEGWNEWGADVVVPSAGCYYIEAIWHEGHWRVTFPAGT